MQVDDLFYKIGVLTMENDMLRRELNQAKQQIADLEKSVAESKETAKESPKEK